MNPTLATQLKEIIDFKEVDSAIEAKLYTIVLELLNTDTKTLYNVLYRIDLDENKVKAVFFDHPEVEKAAERLTKLILERQFLKLKMREKYGSK